MPKVTLVTAIMAVASMWILWKAGHRAGKELFGAEHVNVQPHSGAQANTAVYFACLQPGDTILGMNLAHGGHLTHGSPVNISGKYFKIVPYGVDPEQPPIDYDEVRDWPWPTGPK